MKLWNLSLIIILFSSCQSTPSETPPSAPPNIVLVYVDDLGYADLECYGSATKTPNLNQLAAEGAKLTNFHVAQPVCSASRASLLTGCYPNRLGIHGALMPNSPVGLNPEEITLAEMLKSNGYATAIYGKWHLGDHPDFMPTEQGFDEFFGIPYSNDMWPMHPWQGTIFNFPDLPLFENDQVIDTLTDQTFLTRHITERAVDFIQRKKDEPFFLYVPHPQPHVPLFASPDFVGRSGLGLYADVIMELDWSVGEMMKALKNEELEESTIFIFASDNGPWLSYGTHAGSTGIFREGKGTTFEGGTRVPFIIKYPDEIPAGIEVPVPLVSIDVLPSLAHITGSDLPDKYLDGRNAWNVFKGTQKSSPQEAYFFYYKVNELQAVMSGQWKLMLPQQYRSLNGREGGSDGLPSEYEQLNVLSPELYDLENDPSETSDLSAEFSDITQQLLFLADSINQRIGPQGSDLRNPGKTKTSD